MSSITVPMSMESPEYGGRLELQFFVKIMAGGKTLVLQANMEDTVEHLHRKIDIITGIPVTEQRLIYRGKQLQWWQTMEDCGVQNDTSIQLEGRIRSTGNTEAWRLISEMVHLISEVSRDDTSFIDSGMVKEKADQFMSLLANDKTDCYKIFLDAYAAQAFVMMYMSVKKTNKDSADECIRCFMSLGGKNRGENAYRAMMLLEFCRLLKTVVPPADVLYLHCRSALGIMLNEVEVECRLNGNSYVDGESQILFVAVIDLFPILEQVGRSLRKDLVLPSTTSTTQCRFLDQNVSDFSAFLKPVLTIIARELAAAPDSLKGKGKGKEAGKVCSLSDEVDRLFYLFIDLLSQIEKSMLEMKGINRKNDAQAFPNSWSHYLTILKELRNIALIYPGLEVRLLTIMRKNKVVVNALVVIYASCVDDHVWLIKLKDVLDFESRRHLALLMFPKVNGDYEELHEMLIDRSRLLAESFEYIYNADPSSLQVGLFMGFVNEEAKGPGVLREWFCLVCQALFDPHNALFIACPLDRRRFYPNPASKIDPLHLQYFQFAAGRNVTVEDIKDADPCIYKSCKQILEMDPEFLDSDALFLTFVTETEELGSKEVVELCSGGHDIIVNSKNREEYVHLIVQQRFVKSIAQQVSSFAQGFTDILRDNNLSTAFFKILEQEDLDWMLHGSESQEISVEDWKAHTKYVGYENSDPQIDWFWKVVEQLNAEQKKTLLFFWTSVKYLPVEGFRGLASELFIYKSLEPQDRLPSSHTCFYQLCIPTYPTKAIMQDRLRVITQDHVGFSFGTL
ncbi:E3 ubiquitin-protein ligase UPL5-like isoform X2 [Silene latifolia]|uniref:E3 ubiquitin-protein ligase UPL5-like isoform X2 n=1 Tax=Silene latifolia TaxID=37657 RepID=UPI003D772382